ncbi:MAG: hypothetical protein WCI03_15235, partial [bacterium]
LAILAQSDDGNLECGGLTCFHKAWLSATGGSACGGKGRGRRGDPLSHLNFVANLIANFVDSNRVDEVSD